MPTTLSGIEISVNEVQSENAEQPIFVTLAPIVTLVSVVDAPKAPSAISVTLLGISYVVFVFPIGY